MFNKRVFRFLAEWLGVKQAEEVENRLREMRLDPDRDVRVIAGGEENVPSDMLLPPKTKQPWDIF